MVDQGDEQGPVRPVAYRGFSGGSLERLAALSDGVFAIALTLLVLDLRVPVNHLVHATRPAWSGGQWAPERALWHELSGLGPQLLAYVLGFLALGMFWVGQQTQFNYFTRSNRHLTWIHLVFLFGVSVMPFSTALLAEFMTYRLALAVYWLNLLFLGLVLLASLVYAGRAGLVQDGHAEEMQLARRRIVVVQVLYAVALILCLIDTYVSIVFIVLLQLNSAIAPPVRPLNRF